VAQQLFRPEGQHSAIAVVAVVVVADAATSALVVAVVVDVVVVRGGRLLPALRPQPNPNSLALASQSPLGHRAAARGGGGGQRPQRRRRRRRCGRHASQRDCVKGSTCKAVS